jgi:hypothetical protein
MTSMVAAHGLDGADLPIFGRFHQRAGALQAPA